MKILLIRTNQNKGMGFNNLMHIEPLGLEMLAGALGGHDIRIIDLVDEEDIVKEAARFDPDMCGISCSFTVDYNSTLDAAKTLKSIDKDLFVFVGGHHAAINPKDIYGSDVDAVVKGEGEVTIRDLVSVYERGGDLKEVEGLVLNRDYKIEGQYNTPDRPLVKNLDKLPYPRRDLVSQYRNRYYLGLRWPVYALETARGCPYKCKFCSVWRFYQNSYRMKSAKRVFEEIVNIPAETILVTDDNFFASVERAYRIGELLKEAGVKKYFSIQARSDDIVSNPELLELWREVGLRSVFIGFEQIDQEGLNNLHKRNTIKNNETALFMLQEKGMNITSSFIVDPEYTEKDFETMLDYIKNKGVRTPSFSILTPLPGTDLYVELQDRITTLDYRLYDFLHTVLPTYQPLEKFYKDFASLWRKSYKTNLPRLGLGSIKDILLTPPNWFHAARLLKGMNCMFDEKNYLANHN